MKDDGTALLRSRRGRERIERLNPDPQNHPLQLFAPEPSPPAFREPLPSADPFDEFPTESPGEPRAVQRKVVRSSEEQSSSSHTARVLRDALIAIAVILGEIGR